MINSRVGPLLTMAMTLTLACNDRNSVSPSPSGDSHGGENSQDFKSFDDKPNSGNPSEPKSEEKGPKDSCQIDWETVSSASDLSCFQSIEEVLESLPPKVRPYWVMVHSSKSQQEASMEHPRVIVNAPTGKFILAMETKPDSKVMEVAVFDFKRNVWDFAGIEFQGHGEAQLETESCKSCHSSSPRPIWKGYRDWGAIVGNEDQIKAEELVLLNNARSLPNHRIFKHLRFQNQYAEGQVLRPMLDYPENGNNQIMNFFIARNAARALSSKLLEDDRLSDTQLLGLVYETLCSRDYDGIQRRLADFSYLYQDHLGFHIAGIESEARMWIGHVHIDFFLGLALADGLLKKNAALKDSLSELANTLSAPPFQTFHETDLESFQGWSTMDFRWLNQFYNQTESPSLSCPALREI